MAAFVIVGIPIILFGGCAVLAGGAELFGGSAFLGIVLIGIGGLVLYGMFHYLRWAMKPRKP